MRKRLLKRLRVMFTMIHPPPRKFSLLPRGNLNLSKSLKNQNQA